MACANVGMLVFARTATRAGELSVRTALGASRARIVSQVSVECLVLAVVSGAGLVFLGSVLYFMWCLIPAGWASALPPARAGSRGRTGRIRLDLPEDGTVPVAPDEERGNVQVT